jgi:hypothetical protein
MDKINNNKKTFSLSENKFNSSGQMYSFELKQNDNSHSTGCQNPCAAVFQSLPTRGWKIKNKRQENMERRFVNHNRLRLADKNKKKNNKGVNYDF